MDEAKKLAKEVFKENQTLPKEMTKFSKELEAITDYHKVLDVRSKNYGKRVDFVGHAFRLSVGL